MAWSLSSRRWPGSIDWCSTARMQVFQDDEPPTDQECPAEVVVVAIQALHHFPEQPSGQRQLIEGPAHHWDQRRRATAARGLQRQQGLATADLHGGRPAATQRESG